MSYSRTDCKLHRPEATNVNGGINFGFPQANWAFQKVSDLTAHIKKVHSESPFPCQVWGCSRVGGKGYFRERDLIKHQKKDHPDLEFIEDEES